MIRYFRSGQERRGPPTDWQSQEAAIAGARPRRGSGRLALRLSDVDDPGHHGVHGAEIGEVFFVVEDEFKMIVDVQPGRRACARPSTTMAGWSAATTSLSACVERTHRVSVRWRAASSPANWSDSSTRASAGCRWRSSTRSTCRSGPAWPGCGRDGRSLRRVGALLQAGNAQLRAP